MHVCGPMLLEDGEHLPTSQTFPLLLALWCAPCLDWDEIMFCRSVQQVSRSIDHANTKWLCWALSRHMHMSGLMLLQNGKHLLDGPELFPLFALACSRHFCLVYPLPRFNVHHGAFGQAARDGVRDALLGRGCEGRRRRLMVGNDGLGQTERVVHSRRNDANGTSSDPPGGIDPWDLDRSVPAPTLGGTTYDRTIFASHPSAHIADSASRKIKRYEIAS